MSAVWILVLVGPAHANVPPPLPPHTRLPTGQTGAPFSGSPTTTSSTTSTTVKSTTTTTKPTTTTRPPPTVTVTPTLPRTNNFVPTPTPTVTVPPPPPTTTTTLPAPSGQGPARNLVALPSNPVGPPSGPPPAKPAAGSSARHAGSGPNVFDEPLVLASGPWHGLSLTAATKLSIPIAFGALVALFLLVQALIDRRDPKLSQAPRHSDDETVSFE
jgi:hypothetical protein